MRSGKSLTTETQSRRGGKLFCGRGLWCAEKILGFMFVVVGLVVGVRAQWEGRGREAEPRMNTDEHR